MPFISTNRTVKRPSPIRIILERLMIVSCDDIITLNAQVPAGISVRTYEWVQLSGQTVTWLSDVRDTMVMFQQTLVRDDKVFRFYVNRGTSSEVYADILVTAVPRDELPGLTVPSRSYDQVYADEEVAYAKMMPGFSPEEAGSYKNSLRAVSWNSPSVSRYNMVTETTFIKEFRVYDVTGGNSETLLAVLTPESRSYFDFPQQRTIRVDTVVSRNGVEHVATGVPIGFFPPVGWADADLYDRGRVHLTRGSFSTSISRQNYSVFQESYQSDAQVNLQAAVLLNTVDRYLLTLVVAPTEESDALVNLQTSGTIYQTVTRLDLGIGGLG